ncbi:DUF1538 domain-containing protein [Lacticigenium naphthae]|uniref:DUF1538 domain-containing protein n=1 Tax=Lacticigenium naphthae TaxID=515351 RepID=UPI000481CB6F|nr:DUF1538 domain-containing protein [Lacticigenium naphthae]
MNDIIGKFKEVFFSVLPIPAVVFLVHFTMIPIETSILIRFLLGSFFVVIGLTFFLLGVDLSISPLGSLTGSTLAKTNKLIIVLIIGAILGFFTSIAEPGLLVLANQVEAVTVGEISSFNLVLYVSIGLAIMLALGFFRIFYNIPLYKVLLSIYLLIFGLALFSSREMLAISFDASGSTTGILAVPFILSLSAGISKLKKDSKASEKDSFGLVAIASTGSIIAVLILDRISNADDLSSGEIARVSSSNEIFYPFVNIFPVYFLESIQTILPLFIIFLLFNIFAFHLKKRKFRQIFTGFIFTFLGLIIFLVGINAGFMDVGTYIGTNLVKHDNKMYIISISFLLGVVTILAEPAVYVLTQQIEEVTTGYVKRKVVLIPLALGGGVAVMLSVIRILVPSIQLWHFLLPGYIISLGLMFIVPKLFVGMAFDAGGVATGPMTATFILAFIQGAANAYEGANVIIDGFGMIAMVAMAPIITLQLLGWTYKIKLEHKEEKEIGK